MRDGIHICKQTKYLVSSVASFHVSHISERGVKRKGRMQPFYAQE
jgi:hypothetical protein